LRVYDQDSPLREVYVTNGLTIGRSVANAIVVEDEVADRTHAQVGIAEDGMPKLTCVGAVTNTLFVNGEATREVTLSQGVRFGIGRIEFECVAGRRDPINGRIVVAPVCPFCGSTELPQATAVSVPCLRCGQPILLLCRGDELAVRVVPGVFGEFRAISYVGHGGMGIVLKGIDNANVPVAIKVLLPECSLAQHTEERFEQEIAIMRQVRDPNVVSLLGSGRSGSYRFLVMEWMDGGSLADVIAKLRESGQLVGYTEGLYWFRQVLSGLSVIHTQGVIHRDIKPSNILLDARGLAKVADMGIAKRSGAANEGLTTTGMVPGTYEYMAPEALSMPLAVDYRADQYSLGATFYELFTGQRPVGTWAPVSSLNREVPKALDGIMQRLLASEPQKRFSSTQEVLWATCSEAIVNPLVPDWSVRQFIGVFGLLMPILLGILVRLLGFDRFYAPFPGIGIAFVILWMNRKALRLRKLERKDVLHCSLTAGVGVWVACMVGLLDSYLCPFGAGIAVYSYIIKAIADTTGMPTSATAKFKMAWPIWLSALLAMSAGLLLTGHTSRWYRRLGNEHGCYGEYEKAISDFTEAIRLDPKLVGAYFDRGSVYWMTGETDKAISDCTEAIRLDPKLVGPYVLRGESYASEKEYGKAITDLTSAIRLDPKNAYSYYIGRGSAYLENGETDKAIADFTEAIRLDPKLVGAYRYRGDAYQRKGETDKAIADFTEAIQLNPKHAGAHFGLGNCYFVKKQLDDAIREYLEAAQLDPKDGVTFWNLGVAYQNKDEKKLAEQSFAKAKELGYKTQPHDTGDELTPGDGIDPADHSAGAYCALGNAYFQKDKYDKAIAAYTAAIRLNPGYSDAYHGRGYCYSLLGRQQEAEADFAEERRLRDGGSP
jgi:tetratricopeptide (TPR) repeat protein